MEILYTNSIDSTQEYLISELKSQNVISPIAIVAKHQTNGRGSRGNEWISGVGNLYLSFALPLHSLPNDLQLSSSSIYYAVLLKYVLKEFGSQIHIKWPNDFYVDNKKVGGIITSKIGNNIVCGIGLNTKYAPEEFGVLDININNDVLLQHFFDVIDKCISWEVCLENFRQDFVHSKYLYVNIEDKKVSLDKAILLDDGSIKIDDKIIYSLR